VNRRGQIEIHRGLAGVGCKIRRKKLWHNHSQHAILPPAPPPVLETDRRLGRSRPEHKSAPGDMPAPKSATPNASPDNQGPGLTQQHRQTDKTEYPFGVGVLVAHFQPNPLSIPQSTEKTAGP
jgi:hypothetical protein